MKSGHGMEDGDWFQDAFSWNGIEIMIFHGTLQLECFSGSGRRSGTLVVQNFTSSCVVLCEWAFVRSLEIFPNVGSSRISEVWLVGVRSNGRAGCFRYRCLVCSVLVSCCLEVISILSSPTIQGNHRYPSCTVLGGAKCSWLYFGDL